MDSDDFVTDDVPLKKGAAQQPVDTRHYVRWLSAADETFRTELVVSLETQGAEQLSNVR